MNKQSKINENLISSRNILLNDRSNNDVLNCLQYIQKEVDYISIPSTKAIIQGCTAEAIAQIKKTNFMSAGLILNLIHNLPLDEIAEQKWSIDYFLSMELPVFLERFDEMNCSRVVTLLVCGQLATRYLPSIKASE